MKTSLFTISVISALLMGCSGGGGGNNAAPSANIQQPAQPSAAKTPGNSTAPNSDNSTRQANENNSKDGNAVNPPKVVSPEKSSNDKNEPSTDVAQSNKPTNSAQPNKENTPSAEVAESNKPADFVQPSKDGEPTKAEIDAQKQAAIRLPAEFFPENNENGEFVVEVDGVRFSVGDAVNLSKYKDSADPIQLPVKITSNGETTDAQFRYYQTQYAVAQVAAKNNVATVLAIGGWQMPWANVPNSGSANYQGQAYLGDKTGVLDYQVDFAKKVGSGKITGFEKTGEITLLESKLAPTRAEDSSLNRTNSMAAIHGNAKFAAMADAKPEYDAYLFGNHGEEMMGVINSTKLDEAGGDILFKGNKK